MLALLATAQLIISVDYNIVYVALPEIGERSPEATRSQVTGPAVWARRGP